MFVQELTSLKIWEQMKTIYLQKDKQFSYLYLTCQGIIEEILKAWITKVESHSSQMWFQPFFLAILRAIITAKISEKKANWIPMYWKKTGEHATKIITKNTFNNNVTKRARCWTISSAFWWLSWWHVHLFFFFNTLGFN